MRRSISLFVIVLACCAAACTKKKGSDSNPTGETSAPSDTNVSSQPADTSEKRDPAGSADPNVPYAGPTGTVAGVVKMKGDKSPPLELGDAKIPVGTCFEAHEMYKSLFREGPNRTLADVLVAVTGYDATLPAPPKTVQIEAKGCAFETRTVGLMLGQGLSVLNKGPKAVTPQLLGARSQALLIAIPGGEPIEVHPQKVGLHKLIDRSHEFAFAEVYVVPYSTTSVTGLDGRFEISGVPVGSVKVNALLPALGKTAERDVTVVAGKTVEVELEMEFDAAKDLREPASPSATP